MVNSNDNTPIVEMKNISKNFGGLQALKDVDLTLKQNEILGLVGDNGAGKSTLIKILTGAYTPSKGEIYINGEKVNIDHPKVSQSLGIQAVYQDLSLINPFDIGENVFLGQEKKKKLLGFLPFQVLDHNKMSKEAERIIEENIDIELGANYKPVVNLSGGQQQAVAVARALVTEPNVLILDEPTSSLGVEESEKILELVKSLKRRERSIIMISHNIDYVLEACDRVEVLRQGEVAGVREISNTEKEEIVSMIVSGKLQKKN